MTEKKLIPMQVMIDAILINKKWGLESRVLLSEDGRLEAASSNVDMYKTNPRAIIAYYDGDEFRIKSEYIEDYEFQIKPEILLR